MPSPSPVRAITTLTDPVAETGAELVVTDDMPGSSPTPARSPGASCPTGLPDRSRRRRPHPPRLLPPVARHPRHRPRPGWRPERCSTSRRCSPSAPSVSSSSPPGAAFGLLAATVTAGLLAVNELMVWQAKFPTAESLSLFVYTGALLAVALALSHPLAGGRRPRRGLVGVGFVARPEGIVVVGLAAIVLAGLWVFDRLDGRAWAFAAGFAPLLLLGTYQAYGRGSRYAAAAAGPALVRGGRGRSGPARPRRAGGALGAFLRPGVRLVGRGAVRRVEEAAGRDGPGAGLAARRLRPGRRSSSCSSPWPGSARSLLGPDYRIDKRGERSRGATTS